jgi:ABC-type lipoprotein release transport system permease subunit
VPHVARRFIPFGVACLVATIFGAGIASTGSPEGLRYIESDNNVAQGFSFDSPGSPNKPPPSVRRSAEPRSAQISRAKAQGLRYSADGPADESPPGVLLSRQLVEQEHIRIGDVVTLALDARGDRATRFRVAGVYEPTPDPKKFPAKRLEARLHLPDLITLTADRNDPLSAESVSAVNLALVDPQEAARVVRVLETRAPGLIVESTAPSGRGDDPFAVLDRFHWAIAIVTVAGSTAFLLALMVIRADERREIIGILRLMGIPPRSILVEVLLEGFLIATAGAVFGTLIAVSAQGLVNAFFQWRYDTTLVFVRVTGSIVLRCIAFAVPLGIVAGLVASWTLLRRDVVSLIGR